MIFGFSLCTIPLLATLVTYFRSINLEVLWKTSSLLWQPLITKTNSNTTSKSLSRISSGDHKRTQQEVLTIFLYYLYQVLMVHASNKQLYPNVHIQSMLLPCVNLMSSIRILCYIYMPDIILLVLSSRVQAYDFTSYEISCDCSHVPLHCQIIKIKIKEKLKEKKY